MSSILLATLVQDLDPSLQAYISDNESVHDAAVQYLNQLLVNENLLSTDAYSINANENDKSRKKTITEEIAELDDQQRDADKKLAEMTNLNRDVIVDISQQLKSISDKITKDMSGEASDILRLLKADEKSVSRLQVNLSDTLIASIETNSCILSNIDSVLDLLELPALCKICIVQGNYSEALEISVLVKSLMIKFPKLVIFAQIDGQIKRELNLMTKGLIKLLNTNLKQINLIKAFNILNKLDLKLSDDEPTPATSLDKTRFLKLIYFNSRFKFIISELANLKPLIKFNKLTYLKRYIEVYREFIFNSLSIFSTIFNHSINLSLNESEDRLLVNQFVKNLAQRLIDELKLFVPQLKEELGESEWESQFDGLILQIIYLCKSLSKYNQNFENIMAWELCFSKTPLVDEKIWLSNLNKVKKFRS